LKLGLYKSTELKLQLLCGNLPRSIEVNYFALISVIVNVLENKNINITRLGQWV